MSAIDLADIPPGFAEPVHDAQSVFRRLLDAMARPVQVETLTDDVSGQLAVLPGTGAAAAALLLTLTDADVRLHLAHAGAQPLGAWLRFHTGVRLEPQPDRADWLLVDAASLGADNPPWRDGDDEAPHTAPTLLVEVPTLGPAPQPGAIALRLHGPGIETEERLSVGGVAASFWRWRIAQQAQFPRGVDIVLCCAHRFAALPRSTRVEILDQDEE